MSVLPRQGTRALARRQRGVALFVGLVFLLILTVLTLTTARSTLMQERIAGNVREASLAFQGAENILRQVERRLAQAAETGTTQGLNVEGWPSTGLEIFDCAGQGIPLVPSSWAAAPDGLTAGGGLTQDMRYRLVQMSNVGGRAVACKPLEEEPTVGAGNRSSYYLILSHARGPAGRGDSIVTSTYYYED